MVYVMISEAITCIVFPDLDGAPWNLNIAVVIHRFQGEKSIEEGTFSIGESDDLTRKVRPENIVEETFDGVIVARRKGERRVV